MLSNAHRAKGGIQGAPYVLGHFSSLKDLKSDPKHMAHPVNDSKKHLFEPNSCLFYLPVVLQDRKNFQ